MNEHGEVLEWTNRHAWRACDALLVTVGSNPTLSAINWIGCRATGLFNENNR
jgi:hypothetical protein